MADSSSGRARQSRRISTARMSRKNRNGLGSDPEDDIWSFKRNGHVNILCHEELDSVAVLRANPETERSKVIGSGNEVHSIEPGNRNSENDITSVTSGESSDAETRRPYVFDNDANTYEQLNISFSEPQTPRKVRRSILREQKNYQMQSAKRQKVSQLNGNVLLETRASVGVGSKSGYRNNGKETLYKKCTFPAMAEEENCDETNTLSQLELSIVVDSSPKAQSKNKKQKRMKTLKPDYVRAEIAQRELESTTTDFNKCVEEFDSDVIQHVQSEDCENLSNQISQILSQNSCVNGEREEVQTCEGQTLGGNDTRTQCTPDDRNGQACISSGSRGQGPSKSLLETFKSITQRHDSAVKLLSHDFRNGKYNNVKFSDFVIRAIVERFGNGIQTIAYDLAKSKDRCILFKPADKDEILEGIGKCLRLYMPWQEISIDGIDEPMIIAADFYKIFRNTEFQLSDVNIESILSLPLPTPSTAKVLEPLFADLVPTHVMNRNTIQKQLSQYKFYIDVDVVVLNVWEYPSNHPTLCLIKDSDNFIAFLEIPRKFDNIISLIHPGEYYKITSLAVLSKTSLSENLAPFSVIYLFGAKKQRFFFTLKWEDASELALENNLDISIDHPANNQLNMEQLNVAPIDLDCRITLKCKLKEKGSQNMLVHDLNTDHSMMINVVLDADMTWDVSSISVNDEVVLKFLRLIHGNAIWDKYTVWEELQEEDEFDLN